jgi:DNA polymerase
VLATVHPSSLLRAPDDETRRRETQRFVEDLRTVAAAL